MSKPILEESFHSFNDNTAYDHMFRHFCENNDENVN